MFKNLGKLVKTVAPIAIGAYAPYLAPAGMNPFVASALTSGIGAALTGAKPKDAILAGIMGGAAGSAFGPSTAAAEPEQMLKPVYSGGGRGSGEFLRGFGKTTVAANPSYAGGIQKALTATPETFSATLLEGLGGAGSGEGNLLFKLLNTKIGEGLAAGTLAQALASLTEEEKEELAQRRAFGEGYGGGQLGGINYADGGEAYFPRRNGGIDPSEGSGRKDDVPAMLMAGEFVMTRDAVKGMGDGNLRKGIGRMYKMMDNLERQA